MRHYVQHVLNLTAPEPAILLSSLKPLFRSYFQVDLSETALGYAKLSECLQDARLADICAVQLESAGYTLVRARPHVQRSLLSLFESLSPAAPTTFGGYTRSPAAPTTFVAPAQACP